MFRSVIVTMCIALGATHAAAAAPVPQASQGQASTTRLVRHSGVLTDAAGAPLTGTHTVTFSLFDQAEGGTVLWTETITVTADERGRYATHLGAGQMLPLEHFSSEQARWVETSVNGHAGARAVLVAVPYALKAADAETLGGKPVSSFLTTGPDGRVQRADGTAVSGAAVEGAAVEGAAVDGSGVPGQIAKWSTGTTLSSSTISESASNRVGFGLTDPTGGGVVDSVFSIKNFDNNTGFAILNETQQRRFAINTLFSGGWLMYDGGSGAWMPGLGQFSGLVGIGNTAPDAMLHVGSTTGSPALVRLDSPLNSSGPKLRWTEATSSNTAPIGRGFEANYDANLNKLIFRSFNAATIIADNVLVMERDGGQVGIGTVDPVDRLHVNGDIRVGISGTTFGCVKDENGTLIAGACSSDFRFKKNINAFSGMLGKLSQLQPVYFDWRADEFPDKHFGAARSFGLIAQDVEAVLPELVVTDDKGYKAVKYNQLPFHMLQAIKELKTENDGLKEQLKSQEDRLRRLEALAGK